MGKFNPAGASRADFTALFNAWKENDIVTELYMRNAMQAYHTAFIDPINVKQREKYDPCYDEVVGARGGYETLDERLDAMSGGGGASDYDELDNRPQINSVTLTGNKSLADLGIAAASDLEGKAAASALTAETAARTAADESHTAMLIELLNGGAKNVVAYTRGTETHNGVTFTVNDDLSVTLSGVASQYFAFRIIGDPDNTGWVYGQPIDADTYILSGLPSGASSTTFRYLLGLTASSSATRTSESIYTSTKEFTVQNDTTRFDLSIYVATGADFSTPVTIKPMITKKKYYQLTNKYVAGSPTNAQLFKMIRDMQNGGSASVQSLQSTSQLMSIRPDADLTGGSEVQVA